MKIIELLNNVTRHDTNIAGGKGASLGEMTKAGISVPPGFIILASAFEKFLEETNLNVEIDSESNLYSCHISWQILPIQWHQYRARHALS